MLSRDGKSHRASGLDSKTFSVRNGCGKDSDEKFGLTVSDTWRFFEVQKPHGPALLTTLEHPRHDS